MTDSEIQQQQIVFSSPVEEESWRVLPIGKYKLLSFEEGLNSNNDPKVIVHLIDLLGSRNYTVCLPPDVVYDFLF